MPPPPRFSETGEYLGYIGSVIDISERQAATAAVAESEARFRALVEASAQIVWSCDAEGRPSGASDSWLAFTGQSAAPIGGQGLGRCHPSRGPGGGDGPLADCIATARPY